MLQSRVGGALALTIAATRCICHSMNETTKLALLSDPPKVGSLPKLEPDQVKAMANQLFAVSQTVRDILLAQPLNTLVKVELK